MSDDDNVVPFGKPVAEPVEDNRIWVCTNCSCITWKMRATGEMECAHCGQLSDGGEWFNEKLRATETEIVPESTIKVTDFMTSEVSFAKTIKDMQSGKHKVGWLVYVSSDGFIGTWGGCPDGDEQQIWLAEHFTTGLNILVTPSKRT